MFIQRFHGEIIFHLFSVIFFDLIYLIVLRLLVAKEDLWLCATTVAVFGYLHLRYFRNFCRNVRWSHIMPHVAFPLLLGLVAYLTYT